MVKTKTVYRNRPKRRYSRKNPGGMFGLNMKNLIDGGLAGFGGQVAQRWVGPWGHPVASILIGAFRRNSTLQIEGAREAGALLATMIPIVGGGTSPYAGGGY